MKLILAYTQDHKGSFSIAFFSFFNTMVHQHAWCGRANSVCDLKADEHKAHNTPDYSECVDTDIKMKCQNQGRDRNSAKPHH